MSCILVESKRKQMPFDFLFLIVLREHGDFINTDCHFLTANINDILPHVQVSSPGPDLLVSQLSNEKVNNILELVIC